jgi:hypothetical protein
MGKKTVEKIQELRSKVSELIEKLAVPPSRKAPQNE